MQHGYLTPLGRAWLKQINLAIREGFDDLHHRWELDEQVRQQALQAAAAWVASKPLASVEMCIASMMEFRR